jgi:hypothetical protein
MCTHVHTISMFIHVIGPLLDCMNIYRHIYLYILMNICNSLGIAVSCDQWLPITEVPVNSLTIYLQNMRRKGYVHMYTYLYAYVCTCINKY